jgi:hypothetical protein
MVVVNVVDYFSVSKPRSCATSAGLVHKVQDGWGGSWERLLCSVDIWDHIGTENTVGHVTLDYIIHDIVTKGNSPKVSC